MQPVIVSQTPSVVIPVTIRPITQPTIQPVTVQVAITPLPVIKPVTQVRPLPTIRPTTQIRIVPQAQTVIVPLPQMPTINPGVPTAQIPTIRTVAPSQMPTIRPVFATGRIPIVAPQGNQYQPIVYSQRPAVKVTTALNEDAKLVLDCFLRVTDNLNYWECVPLMLTCQTLYAGILRQKTQGWPSHTLGKITLRHLQHVASAFILPQLLQMSNPELYGQIDPRGTGLQYFKFDDLEYPVAKPTALSSPMGFGKTLVMLHFLITKCANLKVIVTMPPHVLKCWITQLEMLGSMNTTRGQRYGYHPDPGFSYALILHSSRSKHKVHVLGTPAPKNGVPPKDYKPVKGIGKQNIFQNHSLVLVTSKSLKGGHNDLLALADLVVVDECHKVAISLETPLYLGMSGETSSRMKEFKCIEIGHKVRQGPRVLPTICKVSTSKDGGVGDAKSTKSAANLFFAKHSKECLNAISRAVLNHGKVTLAIDGGEMGKSIIKWIGENLVQYRLFILKTSDNTVRQFEAFPGYAILIINTASNEGLSIYTSVGIVMFPELYSSTRLRQLRGRFTRPNSPFPEVRIIWICMGTYGVSKLRYVEYISHLSWNKVAFDSPSVEWLNKCEGLTRMLGRTPETLTDADACIIYNHEDTELEEKLEFWLDYSGADTVLTETMVRGLLNIPSKNK